MDTKDNQKFCPGKLRNGAPCPNVVTRVIPQATHCFPHELQLDMDQNTGTVIMPQWARTPWLFVQHRNVLLVLGLN